MTAPAVCTVVTWRYQGQSHETDFWDAEDARLFARDLRESGREHVLVAPCQADVPRETIDRIWRRVRRAEEEAKRQDEWLTKELGASDV